MFRSINLIFLIFFCFGFKLDRPEKWKISGNKPTLWIKFCDEVKDQDFDEDDLPSSDPLEGKDVSFDDVIDSIIDDYNDIEASFLRLAVYPEDTDEPDDEDEDTPFSKKNSKGRIIRVCIQSSSNPFRGGHASSEVEEGTRIGCEIVLAKSVKNKIVAFVQTLTHELGHCLGLDHPQSTTHSIMSYFHKGDKIRLLSYDRASMAYLYPEDEYDMREQNTFGLSCAYK